MEEEFKVVIPSVGPRADGQKIEQELPADREERIALDKIGAQVTVARCRMQEELIHELQDADGILLDNTVLTKQVIENLNNHKVIVRYGVGVDNLDVEAATEHGIVVANAPDFCIEEMANHTIMLLLGCAKKLILPQRSRDKQLGLQPCVSHAQHLWPDVGPCGVRESGSGSGAQGQGFPLAGCGL
jgi:D-3-phosphoglycerate dehydrogenase